MVFILFYEVKSCYVIESNIDMLNGEEFIVEVGGVKIISKLMCVNREVRYEVLLFYCVYFFCRFIKFWEIKV